MQKQWKLAFAIAALFLQSARVAEGQEPAAAPKISEGMKPFFAASTKWSSYNDRKAAMIAEDIRSSPDASDYDRFIADERLVKLYAHAGDRAAAVAPQQRVLASSFYQGSEINRAGALLELGKEQLALSDFDGATATANAALALIPKNAPGFGGYVALEQNINRLVTLARNHDPRYPTSDPHAPSPPNPLDGSSLPAFENAGHVCDVIAEHINSATLRAITVPLKRIDARDSTYIQPFDSSGAQIGGVELQAADSADDEARELLGAGKTLIQVDRYYYVLGHEGERFVSAAAFDSTHALRRMCSFTQASRTGKYHARSQLDRLFEDSAHHRFALSLNRYVMTLPGVEAIKLMVEASRRETHPITLAPSAVGLDSDGESIIVSAVNAGRHDVLRYLLENGVDANLANTGGLNPTAGLDIAARKDDLVAAALLLEHGAKTEIRTATGRIRNILDENYFSGSIGLVTLLLDHGADAEGVRPVNFDLIAPGPGTTKLVDKIPLIMRHGGNADHWASSLFDAIAARDQLARASDRLLRENARIPETSSSRTRPPSYKSVFPVSPLRQTSAKRAC